MEDVDSYIHDKAPLSQKLTSFSKTLFLEAQQPTFHRGGNEGTLKRIARKYKLDYIGTGRECVVVKDEPGKVVAFNTGEFSDLDAETALHIQNILSHLFPNNFPIFYSASGINHKEKTLGYTVRQEIPRRFSYRSTIREYTEAVTCGFENAQRIIADLEIPLELDIYHRHFDLDQNGKEYYLDTPQLKSGAWNREKIGRFAKSINIPPDILVNIMKSIDFLSSLTPPP